MEEKLGQSMAVLFKYEKLILAEEETTSAGGCGVSLAAFSCPASACPASPLLFLLWPLPSAAAAPACGRTDVPSVPCCF